MADNIGKLVAILLTGPLVADCDLFTMIETIGQIAIFMNNYELFLSMSLQRKVPTPSK